MLAFQNVSLREFFNAPKYGVISGPYFPAFRLNMERYYLSVFNPNAGKYGPEITPYLDTFHAVNISSNQAMLKYNMRNTFLQKSCRKQGKDTSSRPLFVFFKKKLYIN